MQEVIVDCFTKLFTSEVGLMEDVIDYVETKITEAHNEELVRPFESEEVKTVVFRMHLDKAPGVHGLNPGFFQKCWDVVGEAVTNEVLFWLEEGRLPEGTNYTMIVLLPKKNCPESMRDLRPISLCNVVYKMAAKVLANRLQQVLPLVISECQSAFIQRRLITDNVIIANKILHYLKSKRKGKMGFMGLKTDISKAYDRLEWDFLENMMLKLRFCMKWVSWIMMCVQIVNFKIQFDSKVLEPIAPGRGLR